VGLYGDWMSPSSAAPPPRERTWGALPDRLENPVQLDSQSVWVTQDAELFDYSDGPAVEGYLARALSRAGDLSSTSVELEKSIRDWPSEYHLSPKRSQLLRPFQFERASSVLEVGCGCGAITRFLGETFDDVVAVEGSLTRARLARMRSRDMSHVSVVCAPFQELRFKSAFDIVFCIGVLEYAGRFVRAEDPFDTAVAVLAGALTPSGALVLAIENQFGLKYLASSPDDHTGVMFDGWEGYPGGENRVRTFGLGELRRLLEKHFASVEFSFPYPDYKTPSCVLTESFFRVARVAQLIGGCRERSDDQQGRRSLFDERLALLELERNNILSFFANSFLVVASKSIPSTVRSPHLGVKYATERVPRFRTVTRFERGGNGQIWVRKTPAGGGDSATVGALTLHSTEDRWVDGLSLFTILRERVQRLSLSLEEIFAPCRAWITKLHGLAASEDGRLLIHGRFLDANWTNTYVSGDECLFIDLEWEWQGKISFNALLIRNIHGLVVDTATLRRIHPLLRRGSLQTVIVRVARSLGVRLTQRDFNEFLRLEADLAHLVFGKSRSWNIVVRHMALRAQWPFDVVRGLRNAARIAKRKLRSVVGRAVHLHET